VNGAVSARSAFVQLMSILCFVQNAANLVAKHGSKMRGVGRQWYAWTLVGNTNLDSLLGGYYGPWVITSNGTNLCYDVCQIGKN